jgi:hypothetical protein
MVAFIVDSVRHLEIDEEAFSPVVIDLWKQILLVFKEAGELCTSGLDASICVYMMLDLIE